MSTQDFVAWDIRHRYSSLYIEKNVQIGRFSFELTPEFDMQAFNSELKKAEEEKRIEKVTTPKLSMRVSWKTKSGTSKQLQENTRREIGRLLGVLTLFSERLIFEFGSFAHTDSAGNGNVLIEVELSKRFEEIPLDLLSRAVKAEERIGYLHEVKRNLMWTSLDWYSRGISENKNYTNSFIMFWIGFEALSFWFGNGPKRVCQKCGAQLQEDSISKRLKEFVSNLKIADKKKVDRLYNLRSSLFHRGSREVSVEERDELRGLLKNCLMKCLNPD